VSGDPFDDNRSLRRELQQLLDAIQAIPVREDAYLIGPTAAENWKWIQKCEQRVKEAASKP
jgi:hypothetical protein